MVFDNYGQCSPEVRDIKGIEGRAPLRASEASGKEVRVLSHPSSAALPGPVEGPVPNTTYKDRGSEVTLEGDQLELIPEALLRGEEEQTEGNR